MSLKITKLVVFTESEEDGKAKVKMHQVDFEWDSIDEVLTKASQWDSIMFNSSLRGHGSMPKSVKSWKVYKERKEGEIDGI